MQAERLTAVLADRYAIESEIDSGGMATVYRARDLKHERTVAIKVLRPELAEAIGADRFLREIRTTANLNHPHILPLHDSGQADGFIFYVMPFVKGESLKDRMDREGELPIEDSVQIAREVADALAYAHEEGIIHRDIKPANIMLERGRAFLADFGIAQAKAGAGETKLTGSGMSLGTPSYMSPEQVSGDRELDGRADQYALGCVLFEMLAGHPPFTGADIQAVMRQHMVVDVPSVTQARASVPREVAKAILRALAKSPADRFRTTAEFETALAGATLPLLARIPMGRARGVVFAAAFALVLTLVAVAVFVFSRLGDDGPQLVPGRVVVMPFANRTGDPTLDELAVLAADLVGETIQQMELVELMAVDLARHYAEDAASEGSADVVRAVANAFDAALAVTGNIYATGDSLRYRLDVIDVANGRSLQPVEEIGLREFPDADAAIELLGRRVAGALAMELDPYMEMGEQSLPSPPRLEAYRRHKLGIEAFETGNREEALVHYLAAYALDTMYVWPLINGIWAASLSGDRAQADSLARFAGIRLRLLGRRGQLDLDWYYALRDNDRQAALTTARELARLDPWGFSPIAHAMAANDVNFPREAIEALQNYDPYPEWRHIEAYRYWNLLTTARHMLGEFDQELVAARQYRELYPSRSRWISAEIRALAALGRVEELNALLDQAPAIFPDPEVVWLVIVHGGLELRAHGHAEAAQATYERAIEWLGGRPPEEANRASHQNKLAGALYRAERWEEANEIYRTLAAEQPENLAFLGMVGKCAARMGDTVSAREISARIAEMPWPEHDYEHYYVRAVLAALLGQPDEAMTLLQEAFSRGKPFAIQLHREKDLESLHQREDWQELVRPKG